MGAAYVNDYVQFGRIYQVKIEAGDQAQKVIDNVLQLSVPNAQGQMVPFSSFTRCGRTTGTEPDKPLQHVLRQRPSHAMLHREPSSGEAIRQMQELVSQQLGEEFGYEWTSVAYQETQAGSTTTIVFLMASISGLPCTCCTI